MNKEFKKYRAAISDTDILIHLLKADLISVLNLVFEEIIIPQYIFEVELKKVVGTTYSRILQIINAENSIFKVIDRKKDFVFNKLALPIIEEYRIIVGKGESECAGYASALGIPIVISNNFREFKYFENEYIMLNYFNILALCRYFDIYSSEEALRIYNKINSVMDNPSSTGFEKRYKESMNRFEVLGWTEFLGIGSKE